MSAEDMVDAALVGLDQGELVSVRPKTGTAWKIPEFFRKSFSEDCTYGF